MRKKQKYVDDGHTIYNMDIEGFKWHDKKQKQSGQLNLSKRERFAMTRAAFTVYLPRVLILLLSFSLAVVLLYFWLK